MENGSLASHLSRSLNVNWTETDRSSTCYFLLVVHSKYGPISWRFRDKRRFRSQIKLFPPYVMPPLTGSPYSFVTAVRDAQKTRTSCARGRHNMPPPLHIDLWPRKRCPSHVWRGLPLCQFCLHRPLCSRVRSDVRDRQTDVRRASSLNAPSGRGIITTLPDGGKSSTICAFV